MTILRCAIFSLILVGQVARADLEKYSRLIVADGVARPVPRDGIRVTYLGVNGFQFELNDHALLVDPYFTRVGFWSAALNQRIKSDRGEVGEGLKRLRPRADAVLVTHAHFDHLLDVPEIMKRTGARLYSGPTAVDLVEQLGISANKCEAVKPGDVRRVGPWTVRILAAQHDRLFGRVPFERCSQVAPQRSSSESWISGNRNRAVADGGAASVKAPAKPSDWCLGEPLAFVIEGGGRRIYIDSGGVPGAVPAAGAGQIDLAILGVALPDSRLRFAEVVRQMRPRYVFPSHQDDFFAPLSHEFVFGKLTDFPAVIRAYDKENLPGRLILLDYFRPWTLR